MFMLFSWFGLTLPLLNASSWFFFFSSRRRHTRSTRDWSSDVCSSDLYVHGAAVDRFHGANRWHASIADAHLAAISPCDHRLLVGRRTDSDWWNYRFPRCGSHSGRADRMGPFPVADPRVRTSDSPQLLCPVCAYAWNFNGKWRASSALADSRTRVRGQKCF